MKKIISFVSSIILLFTLAACGIENDQHTFDADTVAEFSNDTLKVENGNFRLECNQKNFGVTLSNLKTGETWGTSPPEEIDEIEYDEFGLPKERNYQLESAFFLNYLEYASNTEVTVLSYDAVLEGHVRCSRIENGFEIEYYLDTIEIMIPVSYILHEDYICIEIDPKKIQENDNKVISISLAPFLCSAANDSADSYLFVPSGSGALVSPKTRTEPIKNFSAQVYGQDAAVETAAPISKGENILLPVIGVRTNDSAVCAIIDNGAESAFVKVDAGDATIGYSAVYTGFQMRGYTYHTSTLFSSQKVNSTIYSDRMIENPVSVRYYPLSGKNADYSGMAAVYRNYLTEAYGMPDLNSDAGLNITFIGGVTVTKSFLGIPYKTLEPTTTLSQAFEIVNELSQSLQTKFSVKLKGFGKSGVDIGNIGGGYKIAGKLGSVKELKKLSSICPELYFDFDLMRFSSASGGIYPYLDSAINPGNQQAFQYIKDIAVHSKIDDTLYYLLKPSKITDSASKLLDKTASWRTSGISLESLSNMLYSDYSDRNSSYFYARNNADDEVIKSIRTLKNSDCAFMATKANDYAAALADIIVDIPTGSSHSYIFEYDIPFYAMVFKGYIPIATESVNLSSNPEDLILHAVECGCELNYTVVGKWENLLIDSYYPYFYSSEYSAIKEQIVQNTERLSDYYKKIEGAHITAHTVLESGIRLTEFDNGVKVYVNYTDKIAISPAGEIAPHDYTVLENLS